MDRQDIFNQVVIHLRKQGCKSLSNDKYGACLYRSPVGHKCALGILIPDSEYKPDWEGSSPTDESNKEFRAYCITKFGSENLNFLGELQGIHDINNVSEWEQRFTEFARDYNLQVPF